MDKRFWETWCAQYTCVLCYIKKEDKILLINRLKKGFGFGKVAAPGGHIENGETPEQTCVREVFEEVGLVVKNPIHVGILNYAIPMNNFQCHVFVTSTYSGEPKCSNEAEPFWSSTENLPYDKMFDDDIYWLEHALNGQKFEFFGRWNENGKLTDHILELVDEL